MAGTVIGLELITTDLRLLLFTVETVLVVCATSDMKDISLVLILRDGLDILVLLSETFTACKL